MILRSEEIAILLKANNEQDPFVITPQPDVDKLRASGSAAIDLRLGTWLLQLQQTKGSKLKLPKPGQRQTDDEPDLTRPFYVPLGRDFILHPRTFVLGVTLEWIRLPRKLAGYAIGRSSWGRRGLIIATAAGVHPGFTGCLTLELSNVGEMPIQIRSGYRICQLFLHEAKGDGEAVDESAQFGFRKPVLAKIRLDEIEERLAEEPSP